MRLGAVLAAVCLLGVGAAAGGVGRAGLRGARPNSQPNNEPYGNVIVFDAATGSRVSRFPVVRDGGAAVSDGTGGFYLAAKTVGGARVGGIAHVRSDGSLDRRFRVPVAGFTTALVVSGHTLYLGGDFAEVAGKARRGLAAVDLASASVLPWAPVLPRAARPVLNLTAVAGNVIAGGPGYASGFDAHSAAPRWSLAVGGSVETQAVVARRLFVAGGFDRLRRAGRRTWIEVRPRNGPIELDPRTGAVERWRPRRPVGDEIFSIAASGTTLYVGGHESGYRVDRATGRVKPLAGRPTVVALGDGRLYLGGNVRDDLLVALDNLAAIDLATGRLTAFRPQLTKYQTIGHIVVSQNHVLASGEFNKSLG